MEGNKNIPFDFQLDFQFTTILHGKLVSSGPDLTGSTHGPLYLWVPHCGFNQPQDHVLCLRSWVG